MGNLGGFKLLVFEFWFVNMIIYREFFFFVIIEYSYFKFEGF